MPTKNQEFAEIREAWSELHEVFREHEACCYIGEPIPFNTTSLIPLTNY